MRFYESHFAEYVRASEHFDLHPEFRAQVGAFPARLADLPNLVIYGPSGAGKYTQTLRLLAPYSPSALHSERHITAATDKQSYTYRASDVHFEVDMSLLGCNSRLLWTEVFSQIADIVAVSPDKCSAIVCLNFHAIHQELLDIFYSYMQSGLSGGMGRVSFVLVSESVSFIPARVLSRCRTMYLARPSEARVAEMRAANGRRESMVRGIAAPGGECSAEVGGDARRCAHNLKSAPSPSGAAMPRTIDSVCANIAREIMRGCKVDIPSFRDAIYDISVYGLDASECVWIVVGVFAARGELCSAAGVGALTARLAGFFRKRNNNYREIFHLEAMFFAILRESAAASARHRRSPRHAAALCESGNT